MDTIKVDLGEGDSAELYKELRHGTSKRVQEIYRPIMQQPEVQLLLKEHALKEQAAGNDKVAIKALEEELLKKLTPIIAPTVDVTGAADTLIIGQVKSWTIGGISLPVTQETLDNEVSEKKREKLAGEANTLYGEIPLALSGAGK